MLWCKKKNFNKSLILTPKKCSSSNAATTWCKADFFGTHNYLGKWPDMISWSTNFLHCKFQYLTILLCGKCQYLCGSTNCFGYFFNTWTKSYIYWWDISKMRHSKYSQTQSRDHQHACLFLVSCELSHCVSTQCTCVIVPDWWRVVCCIVAKPSRIHGMNLSLDYKMNELLGARHSYSGFAKF